MTKNTWQLAVQEMRPQEVDQAVAATQGWTLVKWLDGSQQYRDAQGYLIHYVSAYSPTSDWYQAGSLIEKFGIKLNAEPRVLQSWLWSASCASPARIPYTYTNTDPLIAAMKSYLAAYGNAEIKLAVETH